jgi:twitching motility protein PilU
MEITPYLKLMVTKGASDLFFSAGAPVNIKVEGKVFPVGSEPLPGQRIRELAYGLMSQPQIKTFEEILEMNLGVSMEGLGRFRVNVFRQRGEISVVIRYLTTVIPAVEDLNLPLVLKDLALLKRGLILMVGATGSGKSTTLASMLDYRNANVPGHILTVEDPMEYVLQHKKSIVDQREVGIDTLDYANALKNAMREAPDVIMIGEIRDRDTMRHAITYGQTGHLAFSTLHANNANQALGRIVSFFPHEEHAQLFMDLSLNFRAVISQRLVVGVDGRRLPAIEVMLNTPYIAELMRKGEIDEMKRAIEETRMKGMQSFDQSLYDLYRAGKISREEALSNADSRTNLEWKINFGGQAAGPSTAGYSGEAPPPPPELSV